MVDYGAFPVCDPTGLLRRRPFKHGFPIRQPFPVIIEKPRKRRFGKFFRTIGKAIRPVWRKIFVPSEVGVIDPKLDFFRRKQGRRSPFEDLDPDSDDRGNRFINAWEPYSDPGIPARGWRFIRGGDPCLEVDRQFAFLDDYDYSPSPVIDREFAFLNDYDEPVVVREEYVEPFDRVVYQYASPVRRRYPVYYWR